MHLNLLLLTLPLSASASWFSGNDEPPSYSSWSTKELTDWLKAHNVPVPATETHDSLVDTVSKHWDSASTWTQDQYSSAQKVFSDVRDDTFEAWDESALRSWLLEQGVVAPKDKKEELLLLAKQRYRSYMDASNRWSNWAAESASSVAGTAQTYAAAATNEVTRTLNDATDYVYSTWDDNQLKSYLVEKGVIKSNAEKRRDELLAMMRDAYAKTADPAWDAWSTSYLRTWLLDHNLITPSLTATEKARKDFVDKMNKYYYDTNSYVWDTWTDSDIRAWLVENNLIKDDSKTLKRDKMVKMLENAYTSATTTVLSTWSESQLRGWLVDNGYIDVSESAKLGGKNLYERVKDKFVSTKESIPKSVAPYHYSFAAWPDPRLRAFLVETGVPEKSIPDTRPGLLQRVNEVWSQASSSFTTPTNSYQRAKVESEAIFTKIQNIVNSGVETAENKVNDLWELLTGYYETEEAKGKKEAEKVKQKVKSEAAGFMGEL